MKKGKQQFCFDLDESSLVQQLKDRILTVSVNGNESELYRSTMVMRANLFNHIFKIFTHIQRLQFFPYVPYTRSQVSFADQPPMFSSTLVELHINIHYFAHCLYLFDGRFSQLRILVVNTADVRSLRLTQMNTVS